MLLIQRVGVLEKEADSGARCRSLTLPAPNAACKTLLTLARLMFPAAPFASERFRAVRGYGAPVIPLRGVTPLMSVFCVGYRADSHRL